MAAVTAWFIFRFLQQESAAGRQRRRQRNEYLPSIIKELVSTAAPQKSLVELEIQLEELSQLRHILKIAMQDQDDWSNFSVIDQFQTASIRYQLCEIIYVLALANKIYTPSFRGGYLQRAQKKSTNYEPVKKDNIMLTAFLLLAISLYESATGDHTFSEENALELVIDNSHRYRHSATTLAQALFENFSISSYCLYACEPNWIYTFCNLNGINSLLAHDENTGRRDVELVRASFHKALVEDFMDESGSAHPIRSSPTGLRLPNIVGAANEFSVSCLAAPNFPDLSLRSYAIARHEYMEFDSQCKLSFKNIQSGDMLDPGNYGSSMALMYASSLMAAHEHGDNEVTRQITTMIDNDQALLRTEKDGFVWYEGASLFMKCQLLRARLWLRSGWNRFMQPSSDAVQRGPYLTDVNFEEAMVAKAISYTGDDLDLVLYPGTEAISTWISIKNLKPSSGYMIKDCMRFASNEQGEARISVQLDGRTAIQIAPALS
ncbi:hypothetical protein GGP41_002706 [Bipolaris sorokiniana]|uniref:Linalool dehydratase/isomerase domain-containing protein n=2 Tax=Cochliobolus sativus TaxID=45130 RepID=A0A8H5ZHR0_COCSA|nr:uncharacterized protein COCSADRAFT_162327 [Bipolaris sorokiniana ND90Pr]EMD61783.1 hypothetical protein COCSADRAFT_162327 [Bipolaris sorokiniana ND90Pr]KAF5850451.1 hypothetical protein GGP41_002706 [Bipolaris sorokiniana]